MTMDEQFQHLEMLIIDMKESLEREIGDVKQAVGRMEARQDAFQADILRRVQALERKLTMNEDKLALAQARKAAGEARWAGVSKRARSAQMKAIRPPTPRQRSKARCWCQRYTLATATQRGFDCCKRAGKYPKGKP